MNRSYQTTSQHRTRSDDTGITFQAVDSVYLSSVHGFHNIIQHFSASGTLQTPANARMLGMRESLKHLHRVGIVSNTALSLLFSLSLKLVQALCEVVGASGQKQTNNETEETENGTEDLNDQDLDEPASPC